MTVTTSFLPCVTQDGSHTTHSIVPREGTKGTGGEGVDPIGIFLRTCRRRSLRQRTVEKWEAICRDFDRFMQARDGGILNGGRDDIEDWLDTKANGQLAAKSRAAYITALKAFYRCMIDDGILLSDPTERVTRPKLRPGLPRPIPQDELAIALRFADRRMRCFLLLGALAGLRCCEMAGLDSQDIDWANKTLFVKGEYSKGGGERVIPLHPELEAALRNFGVPKQGAFFTGRQGRRLQAERVSHLINDFLRSADIPSTAHSLRHRFGTDVCRTAGARVAQGALGHATLASTAIYTQVTAEDLRAAVAALPTV